MRRAWLILIAGLIGACGAYFCSYYAGTAHSHHLERVQEPEMAWLKQEFHLNDAEFMNRILPGVPNGAVALTRRTAS